jgi:hypothetical protein
MQSVRENPGFLYSIHQNIILRERNQAMRYSIVVNLIPTLFYSNISALTFLRRQDFCSSVTKGDSCTVNDFPCCVDDTHYAECAFLDNMTWDVEECNGGCNAITSTAIACNLE